MRCLHRTCDCLVKRAHSVTSAWTRQMGKLLRSEFKTFSHTAWRGANANVFINFEFQAEARIDSGSNQIRKFKINRDYNFCRKKHRFRMPILPACSQRRFLTIRFVTGATGTATFLLSPGFVSQIRLCKAFSAKNIKRCPQFLEFCAARCRKRSFRAILMSIRPETDFRCPFRFFHGTRMRMLKLKSISILKSRYRLCGNRSRYDHLSLKSLFK